ncbi:aromatic ring-hydroxylating dioxygenase subunit alpha [Thalassobaculum sp. OXR-137]|uniref:aromatic ring-hydroxylating oxygenase subunit alpha n=1 Tax=Thalassobaculum sp. OXR-137 TaxID=3100173 RepID=UPI002AC9C3D5|nr:aromatic ring-hydroxylating dioxygenase subunit alpha [Thalassobaculum sp. OXR-137]WPZ33999.1 aromatic ring-hydroxylating dioxygenase subunit alpha [Thalassobaculum sp. OXR-137]
MDARLRTQELLLRQKSGFSLERDLYVSPETYALDLELIYYRDWLFVGHDCELAKPGCYLTVQVGAYPVIVIRGADGEIRAFHNACRHRGSRLCSAEKGAVAKLVCPYHQWTYELDGRLLFARDMGPGFDPASYGLKPVHCEGVAGYLFICVADHAPDFAPIRAMIEPYLAPHRLRDAKVVHETTIIENGNWKLVWENNRECYHCAGSHPELCRTFPDTVTHADPNASEGDPALIALWDKCRALGLPSGFDMADDAQYRITRMPLLRNAESYTLSGKAAVKRPLSDAVRGSGLGALLLYHYPTTWNHVLGDHAISFRVLPVGPLQTAVTTKWLVHRDAVEGVDYDLDELTKVWLATNDQDRKVVEENQIGVNSPAYQPGPYSPTQEAGVIQFVDWYTGIMRRRLGGTPERRSEVA